MKNHKNINNKICLSLAMLLILGISFVSAFSVSSPYMANKELNVFPDSKITDLEFVLQNGGGATEDVNVRVLVLEGSEIINITNEDNIYTVTPGAKVPVNLRITLPEDVKIGKIYNIRLEFSTVSLGPSGEFGFGTGQEQNFKVVIIKEVVPGEEVSGILLYVILGILVVLVVVVLILIKRKNKISEKKK